MHLRFIALLTSSVIAYPSIAVALPPATDLPEEVSRSEIITEARSPVDGKPLTAAQYLDQQSQIRQGQSLRPQDQVSPQLRKAIGLLRLRRLVRTFFPFLQLRYRFKTGK